MRFAALLVFVIGAFLATATQARAAAIRTADGPALAATTVALNLVQDQAAPTKHEIDINVNHGGGRAWWASPMWIAIGVLAVIVLILLIVMATRGGGGTTIVRD
jgi:hypothetical protein